MSRDKIAKIKLMSKREKFVKKNIKTFLIVIIILKRTKVLFKEMKAILRSVKFYENFIKFFQKRPIGQ